MYNYVEFADDEEVQKTNKLDELDTCSGSVDQVAEGSQSRVYMVSELPHQNIYTDREDNVSSKSESDSRNVDALYVTIEREICSEKIFGDYQIAKYALLNECNRELEIPISHVFRLINCRKFTKMFPVQNRHRT